MIRQRRPILAILALTALLVAACGASASAPQGAGEGNQFTNGSGTRDTSGSVPGATSAPAPAAQTYDAAGNPIAAAPGDVQLIVRTGTMSLIVKDVPAAVAAARTSIEGLGGHIAASQSFGDKDKPSAQVTYRIPAARFDDALAALHALSLRVETEQTASVEVTGQVIDLAARLENLRATEKALQAIMAQATKIPDILAVQEQLTQVRGQIEQLTAEKAHLEEQAALSTLTVDFAVEIPESQVTSTGWDPGDTIDGAFSQLISLAQGVATLAIEFVIVGIPVALGLGFLGLIAFGLYRLVRRLRPTRSVPPAA